MILRQFNDAGLNAFRGFLAACRENPSTPVPTQFLEDQSLTAPINPSIEIEMVEFESRGDAAKHLWDLLSPLDDQEVSKSAGLWSWLALYFFDQLCPLRNGCRDVKNDYRYVFEPNNMRHFYRHILFIAWRVITIEPKHNRLLLSGNLNRLDQVTVEIMKRLYLTRIPCIFEVLERLYWDDERGRARPGIVTRASVKPGDLIHRFPIRIRQLEMTYDLQSLSADKLIQLLGDEFRQSAAVAASASA
jgi:hypothetical protein